VVFLLLLISFPGWTTSKVYLTNGETRLGFVHILDGRVTIRGEDRLFQFPERAVHRIEQVTGDTALIGRENVVLREKPEKMSTNLTFIPKGCEVIVLSSTAEWVRVEVYGGQRQARGFILVEDLNDSVLLNPPIFPNIKFKLPPPSLKDRYPDRNKPQQPLLSVDELLNTGRLKETDFGKLLSQPAGAPSGGTPETQ
jgi:hypothetical protein